MTPSPLSSTGNELNTKDDQLSVCLSVPVSVCLSVCLFFSLSLSLPHCLAVCLSVCLSLFYELISCTVLMYTWVLVYVKCICRCNIIINKISPNWARAGCSFMNKYPVQFWRIPEFWSIWNVCVGVISLSVKLVPNGLGLDVTRPCVYSSTLIN